MNRFPQAVFLWACLAGIAFGQTNDSSADSSTANSPSTPLSSTEKNKREVAFLGISVGGNVNDVVAKLVNKGFVKNETKGNVTALKGVF